MPPLSHTFDVRTEGAVADGRTLNTQVFQALIDRCGAQGGGSLYFPPGVYVTGSLSLRSHVRLYLDNGCVLKASADRADFPPLPHPHICEGRDTALIQAMDAEGISIEGDGIIDGNDAAYFHMDRPVVEADYDPHRVRQGTAYAEKPHGIEDGPAAPRVDAGGNELRYGAMLLFIRCTDLSFRNFRIVGSPNWCLHLAGCERAVLTGLNIRNSLLVPNADCIDISNSRTITIANCLLEGGDDGIAITPCADGYARAPSSDIAVNNCTIISRSCGIRVGYGIERLSDCVFSNIIIRNSNRAIGLFVRNSQMIENLLFTNITIETRLHTGWWGAAEPIHISVVPGYTEDRRLGVIRNIRFSHIFARAETGILLYAVDDTEGAGTAAATPIQDIELEHVRLEIRPSPLNARYGGNIDLRPAHEAQHQLFASDLAGIYAKNVTGLKIDDFQLRWSETEPTAIPDFFRHAILLEECAGAAITRFDGTAPPSNPHNAPIAHRRAGEV